MWQALGIFMVLGAVAPTSPLTASSRDAATRGLYVALAVCAACHKVALPGAGPDAIAPSFAVIHARYTAADLHRLLQEISADGHREMPPIHMSADEIEDVAAYIATVTPPTTKPRRDRHQGKVGDHRIAFSTSLGSSMRRKP